MYPGAKNHAPTNSPMNPGAMNHTPTNSTDVSGRDESRPYQFHR
jgi:hypothetical protein